MDRAMRMMLAGGVTLLLSGVAFMAYLGYLHNNPPKADGGIVQGATVSGPALSIPAFSLMDQDGVAKDRSILEGRVSVVWFMFTHCKLACPTMSLQMADLQRKLKNTGVQFVAFSLDPAHDTPEVLKEYGAKFEVDWRNWTFLTEPSGQAPKGIGRSIYSHDLKQFVEDAENDPLTLPDKGTMANILHAVNFFIVGPDGNVMDKGWYSSKWPQEMEDLRERAIAAQKHFSEKGLLKK